MKCPPMTEEMFPPPLDLLRDACRGTEAHPAAVGLQFLVCVGNLVGRDLYTYVAETRHGMNEFAVIVGPTATGRKGDAGNLAMAAVADADEAWFANHTGGLSSGEGLIYAVRDPVTARKKDEDVIVDPGVADKRLLLLETEFSAVLKQFGRDKNILSNIVRQAWDGKHVLRSLVKQSPVRATGAHISLIGHATPEDLRAYLGDLDIANGVANRLLFAASERTQVVSSPLRLPDAVRQRLTDHVRGVLEYARVGRHVPRTEAAERAWCRLYPVLSRPRPGLLGALLARGPAHMVRLSLIFATLMQAKRVDVEHLKAAAAWFDYCEASTRIIFADRTGNHVADRIWSEILVGDEMTLSEIRERLFANKIGSAKLADAINLLLEMGEVEVHERDTGGRRAKVVRRIQAARTTAGAAA